MYKVMIVVLFALVFTAAGSVGLVRSERDESEKSRAASEAQEIEVGSVQDIAPLIRRLEDDLDLAPEDHRGWANLGLARVEQTRLTGDLSHYELADDAIARSFALQPDENFPALAAAAALAAGRHQFDKALTLSEEALAINQYDSTALAIRIDALTELGRYSRQLAALREADRLQPGVPITVRYAHALEQRGQLSRAADLLQQAADQSSRADRAFLLALHADLQRRMGRLEAAEESLEASEAAVPDYLEALVSRARLDLARGDLTSGLRRWEESAKRAPDVDHLIELGELYLHLGRDEDARRQFAQARTTVDELLDSGQNEELELAILAADHGSAEDALAAASIEWERRQSVPSADAMAWALHRSGQDARALRFALFATKLDSAEPLPWIHRGTIEAALGMKGQARRHLTHGLSLDPGLSPWQADQARITLGTLE